MHTTGLGQNAEFVLVESFFEGQKRNALFITKYNLNEINNNFLFKSKVWTTAKTGYRLG